MDQFNEKIQVNSLIDSYTTAASTSRHKIKVTGGDRLALLCEVGGNSAVGSTFISAAGTGVSHFQLLESTAASAAGSAVAGATLSLGCATANVIGSGAGVAVGIIQVTSALATTHKFTVCGSTFHATAAGPGRDGQDVAATVAFMINAHATLSRKISAVANMAGTGIIELWPLPGCTAITMETGDASAVMGYRKAQGMIEIDSAKLSTTTPKYIGVSVSTQAGATSVRSVKVLRSGPHSPAFTGKVVTV